MVKRRIHEISKEIKIESKEIIKKLNRMGINVKSHMSTLEDNEVERLLEYLKNEPAEDSNKYIERKRQITSPESDVSEKYSTFKTERKKERQEKKADRGPGLVDRVPSRPPDRRFQEKQRFQEKPGKALGHSESHQSVRPKKVERAKDRGQQGKKQEYSKKESRQDGIAQQNRVYQKQVQPERQANEQHKSQVQEQRPSKGQTKHALGQPVHGAGKLQRRVEQEPGTGRSVEPGERGTRSVVAKHIDRTGPGKAGQAAGPRMESANANLRPQSSFSEKGRPGGDKSKSINKSKLKQGQKSPKERTDRRNIAARKGENKTLSKVGPASHKKGAAKSHKHAIKPPVDKKPVVLGESITVQELALKMYRRPAELIKKLMQLGIMTTINQDIDNDIAAILAEEYGYEVEIKLPVDMEKVLMQEPEDDPGLLQARPCMVTVMGHVDHGKTSLLDAIRETNVTATETGGITQRIGAYQVEHNDRKITFIDTPGHEAFTAMRARGAQVTDIAILVVAADDGVMPQTVEALNHAKEAGIPIIVAINKVDKAGANPTRVKQELTEYGLVDEEWGGDTICVNVSALKKEGLDDLLEMILLVAEISELKANPNRAARGTVIESELDKGRGPVATVLVQNGTLNIGDVLIAGSAFGRVRAMIDYNGHRVKKALPSTPVEVLGFSEVPSAGDVFVVVEDEKLARSIVSRRQTRKREEELKSSTRVSLDDLFKRIQEGNIKELGIIIKADVQGSVEALRQTLERLSTEEVKVNIIHCGVGAVTETDIMLASASNAIIIGFNVRPDVNARKAAENEKVDVRLYRVIYDAIEDVKAAMGGLLEPEYREIMLGRAEIRKIFKSSKIGTIAGCYVLEGKIERDAGVRLVRDGIVTHEGKLDSLKRFKDDAKEVVQGYECGVTLEKFNDVQENDIIEAFTFEEVERKLS
jgi:translation initiation factor IF-2